MIDVHGSQFLEEEPKKAKFGFMAGALGALVLLALAIITWILFHKRYGSLMLSHAIMSTLGLLFIAFGVVWAMGAQKQLRSNQ